MTYGELRELGDCEACPLKQNEICTGGMVCYGGDPIEPPCCSFDDDTDLDEWVSEFFERERRYEEAEDRSIKAKREREAKDKHAQELRRQAKWHVWSEAHEIKLRRKRIAANEAAMHFASSFAGAFNFANEAFGYSERIEPTAKKPLEIENERLRLELVALEMVKKQKLKELRQSRKAASDL